MEQYLKISETEVKIINTTTEEKIIKLADLKDDLARAEQEVKSQEAMANEMIGRAKAERDKLALRVSEAEKLWIIVYE